MAGRYFFLRLGLRAGRRFGRWLLCNNFCAGRIGGSPFSGLVVEVSNRWEEQPDKEQEAQDRQIPFIFF
jgi:hypothetical protein